MKYNFKKKVGDEEFEATGADSFEEAVVAVERGIRDRKAKEVQAFFEGQNVVKSRNGDDKLSNPNNGTKAVDQ